MKWRYFFGVLSQWGHLWSNVRECALVNHHIVENTNKASSVCKKRDNFLCSTANDQRDASRSVMCDSTPRGNSRSKIRLPGWRAHIARSQQCNIKSLLYCDSRHGLVRCVCWCRKTYSWVVLTRKMLPIVRRAHQSYWGQDSEMRPPCATLAAALACLFAQPAFHRKRSLVSKSGVFRSLCACVWLNSVWIVYRTYSAYFWSSLPHLVQWYHSQRFRFPWLKFFRENVKQMSWHAAWLQLVQVRRTWLILVFRIQSKSKVKR